MKWDIGWLLENQVIYVKVEGDVSMEALRNLSDNMEVFIDESDAPLVHILIDDSQLGSIPISIKSLLGAVGVLHHPRLGWLINYGTHDQIKVFISEMVMTIRRVRNRRFATLEESLQFLVSMDSSLPAVEEMLGASSS